MQGKLKYLLVGVIRKLEAKRYRKVVKIITIITTIVAITSTAFRFGIHMYIFNKFDIKTDQASSIGIIGGADGPTAIFLTGSSPLYLTTIVFALLSIIGLLYLFFTKKLQK